MQQRLPTSTSDTLLGLISGEFPSSFSFGGHKHARSLHASSSMGGFRLTTVTEVGRFAKQELVPGALGNPRSGIERYVAAALVV